MMIQLFRLLLLLFIFNPFQLKGQLEVGTSGTITFLQGESSVGVKKILMT